MRKYVRGGGLSVAGLGDGTQKEDGKRDVVDLSHMAQFIQAEWPLSRQVWSASASGSSLPSRAFIPSLQGVSCALRPGWG